MPILPAAAQSLGASLAVAGLLGGIVLLGTVLFDIPAGRFVGILGERKAMIISALIACGALVGAQLSTNIYALGACLIVLGAMNATFGVCWRCAASPISLIRPMRTAP